MNIYYIQITTGQSDNNRIKSQNTRLCNYATWTTNQLTYMFKSKRRRKEEVAIKQILMDNDHKTLRELNKGDRRQRTRIIEYSGDVQNEIVDWPEELGLQGQREGGISMLSHIDCEGS